MPKSKNSVRASAEIASLASAILRDDRYSDVVKSAAASALSNRRPRNK